MSAGRRRALTVAAVLLGLAAAVLAIAAQRPQAASSQQPSGGTQPEPDSLVAQGRDLFQQGCSDCHGLDARGIAGIAPDLHGVGARSADFYLRTGRMPMSDPKQEPVRGDSPYDQRQIDALVAYVASLGGPGIPDVHTEGADVARGKELFTENCAGCHQVVGQGGILPGAVAPDLQQSSPADVAEAVAIGPYVMPRFPGLTDREVAEIAAYVETTRDPEDRGGWGIGHIGPIPEGMVAWLLAGAALLIAIRLIGERTTR